MRTERQKIHKFLIDDGRNLGSLSNFQKWDTAYFSLEKNAKSFWSWATKNKIKNGDKKGKFYTYKNWDEFVKTYCCDKTWAKSTQYCGGGQTPTPTDLETITNAEILKKLKEGGEEFWDKIKIGNIISGKVKDLKPFGALIQLDDETNGLIHTSELEKFNQKIEAGQEVKVKVIAIDRSARKIFLTLP